MPTSVAGLLAQARGAYQAGDVATATKLFRSAAEASDASAAVLLELAGALWANFEFDEAFRVLEDAMQRDPANPFPAVLAAKRAFTCGRFNDSARYLTAALQRDPTDNALRRMLAELRDRAGRLVEAEVLAREALKNNPNDALSARALAHTLRRAGRLEDAQEILSRHLTERPGPEDWRLNYELAACHDRRGDYTGAMSALERAKTQLRPSTEGLLKQWQQRKQRREEFARGVDRPTLERWQATTRQLKSVAPVAVLAGHPRSGTTLLEQILAAHSGVVTTDETGVLRNQFIEPMVLNASSTEDALREVNEFDTEQLESGRALYFRATAAHVGEPLGPRLLVEKDPLATQDLGFILRLLPECCVIFPLRDPRDVCISFFFTLVPLNADSAPALDLASTCASVALSLRLWEHWREAMPQRWIQVRYEHLVREPESELRPLVQTLGLPWEQTMLEPTSPGERGVRSPTYADVAQPLYSRAVGRWKHYASWLEPHLTPLRSLLRNFGYE